MAANPPSPITPNNISNWSAPLSSEATIIRAACMRWLADRPIMAKSLSTPALNCGRRFAADAEFLQIYELQFGAMAYTRTPMSRLFVAALSCWIGKDTLLNPKAIVEVLSPFTEGYDRGFRFAH